MVTKEKLYAFEEWCVDTYKKGYLRSPLHLSGSVDGKLEDFLIELFKQVKPNDWVFTTYRSHYHALLKGVPEDWLMNWILNNKSIHVMNREHKIITSAIVGGTLSEALGVAMAIKLKRGEPPSQEPHVWVFCGDMTSTTGSFHEVQKYAYMHNLPITFVVEDNGLSTDTNTAQVWNGNIVAKDFDNIKYIQYTRLYPHYGCGVFVDFKEEDLKQDGSNF